jgi:hypothetical protein
MERALHHTLPHLLEAMIIDITLHITILLILICITLIMVIIGNREITIITDRIIITIIEITGILIHRIIEIRVDSIVTATLTIPTTKMDI